MAKQQRVVREDELRTILWKLEAEVRSRSAGRFTYWSKKLKGWVTATMRGPGTYVVEWDGTKDCGC